MSLASVKAQAKVIGTLMAGWCIDPKQVFFAGHSDGGTVSTILALLPESRGVASGIAVSAAGVLPLDTQPMGCPSKPLNVLLMHAEDDTHFPGYGRKMAQWWSQCFRCTGVEAKPDAKGCRNYIGCESSELKFCEGSGGHTKWPAMQSEMLNFFCRNNWTTQGDDNEVLVKNCSNGHLWRWHCTSSCVAFFSAVLQHGSADGNGARWPQHGSGQVCAQGRSLFYAFRWLPAQQ